MLRAWESFSAASCCRSLVIVYGGNCLLQIGVAAAVGSDPVIIDVPKLMQGSLYRNAMKSGKRMYFKSSFRHSFQFPISWRMFLSQHFKWLLSAESYLANLSLYPGKSELPFLPVDTQVLVNLYGKNSSFTGVFF